MRLSIKELARIAARVAVAALLAVGLSAVKGQDDIKRPGKDGPERSPTLPVRAEPVWFVNCTSSQAGFDCRGGQTRYLNNKRYLTVAVRVQPDKKPVLLIQPHFSVYLPAGMTIQFGNGVARAVEVKSCDQNGCLAEHPLTEADIEAMLKGSDLKIEAQNLAQEPTTINVPVEGFPAVYAKIR